MTIRALSTTGLQVSFLPLNLYDFSMQGLLHFFEQVPEDYGVIEDGIATEKSLSECVPIPQLN